MSRVKIPQDKWFKLEVDSAADPMNVVTTVHPNVGWVSHWKYLGPQFAGGIYRVKLVNLGYYKRLGGARRNARKLGYRLLEGPACEPFRNKFPKHNGHTIVFGGSEWQYPNGAHRIVYLGCRISGGWGLGFRPPDYHFLGPRLHAVVALDA